MENAVEMRAVERIFQTEEGEVRALDGIDLTVKTGEFAAIVGRSGSGKTTLMNIMGCLDRADSGAYFLEGEEVSLLGERALSEIRNRRLGFVFQSFHLIPTLTAAENIELPLIYGGMAKKERKRAVENTLQQMGLEDRGCHYPRQLSGGQQQRVAIARAIAAKPPIILADEPTGNLDPQSGKEILEVLLSLWREGRTLILITHDMKIAEKAPRHICMERGRIL